MQGPEVDDTSARGMQQQALASADVVANRVRTSADSYFVAVENATTFLPRWSAGHERLITALLVNFFGCFCWLALGDVWGNAVLAVLCLYDVYYLSTNVTTPLETSIEDESKLTTRISKSVDRFFSRGQEMPSVSFLVNVVYMLSILVFGGAFFFFTSAFVAMTTNEEPTSEFIANSNNRMGIPNELQEWASRRGWYQHQQILPEYIASSQKGSMVITKDGTVYFRGTKPGHQDGDSFEKRMRFEGFYGDVHNFEDIGQFGSDVLWMSHNGEATSFPNIPEPNFFTLIDSHEAEASYTKFCFLSTSGRTPLDGLAVFCSTPPKQQASGLRITTLFRRVPLPSNTHCGGIPPAVGFDGKLWIRCTLTESQDHRFIDHTVLYAIDYTTMTCNYAIVGSEDYSRHRIRHIKSSFVAFGLAIAGASVFVLAGRGIPAGAATFCLGIKLALVLLLDGDQLVNVVNLVWVVWATRILVISPTTPRFWFCCVRENNGFGIHKDVLLWGLYSGIVVLLFPLHNDFDQSAWALVWLALCVAVGLILNHPVCQALGWISAMVFTFLALFRTWSTTEMLWTLVAGGIMSWGLGTLGYKLAQHRPYLVVLFRDWNNMIRSRIQGVSSNGSEEQEEEDLTVPLRDDSA